MKVGINVAILGSRLTGVGHYTLSLIRALAQVGQDVEWVFLGVPPALEGIPQGYNIKLVSTERLVGWRRVVWEQSALAGLAAREGVDLLHCPDFSRPVFSKVPVINTVHDLSYYCPQQYFSRAKLAYRRTMVHVTMKRSRAVITVSHFTRREILERFSVDPGNVHAIHLGVESLDRTLGDPGLPPYILYVGAMETRKNVVALINAFTALRQRARIPHRLVLAGQPGWGWQRIQEAIQASPFRGEIEELGYVDQKKLWPLYRSADVFVFPSLYESFGLPVLEAMACGTPVVCSRASCLPEIAGDAAEFFDPSSAEDLAGALERVLTAGDLRSHLRQEGFKRAAQFTWEECARKHCQVYRQVQQY